MRRVSLYLTDEQADRLEAKAELRDSDISKLIRRAVDDYLGKDMLSKAIDIASRCRDGHLTIMKFTTNWRFCYGTAMNIEDIDNMSCGKTMEEAIQKGITKTE